MRFNLQRDRPLTSQHEARELRMLRKELKSDRPVLKRSFLEDEESGYFKFQGENNGPRKIYVSDSSEPENQG